MSVRNMNGDPSIWETLGWADLSSQEKEMWTALGWSQQVWDTQENVPATAAMEWKNLNDSQQSAAEALGFTKELWDGYEDQ